MRRASEQRKGTAMRVKGTGTAFRARAISGSHVVVLAWDTINGKKPARADLLGFAIERSELARGAVKEQYWLRGIKRFKDKDKGLPPGTPVPTSEHPIQTFQWGDYTAKAGTHYQLSDRPGVRHAEVPDAATTPLPSRVDITTETEAAAAPRRRRHPPRRLLQPRRDRLAGLRAGVRQREPDADEPALAGDEVAVARPVRGADGLHRPGEGRLSGCARRSMSSATSRSPTRSPRRPQAGADVKIVYDAESSYKAENEETIGPRGLDDIDAVIPRTVERGHPAQQVHRAAEGRRRRSRSGPARPTSPPAASSATPTSATSSGTRASRNGTSTTGSGSRTTSRRRSSRRDRTAPPRRRPPASRRRTSCPPFFSARDDEGRATTTLQWYADRMARGPGDRRA